MSYNNVDIKVTADNTEDAAIVAEALGQTLRTAGFRDVNVESSIVSDMNRSYFDILREINPALMFSSIYIGFSE